MDSILTSGQSTGQLLESLQTFRGELAGTGKVSDPSALADFLADLEQPLTQFVSGLNQGIQIDLFGKTAMLLASALDEEEILAAMLDGLKPVLPYDAAGIYLAEAETPLGVLKGDSNHGVVGEHAELSVLVARGYSIEEHKKFKQKFNEGVVGWVIANSEPVIVDDARQDDRYIMLRPETRSEISVPIISRDVVVGAINLEADKVAAFSSANLRLLENLASYAAVALERARTHCELMDARSVERELEIAREIQTKLLPTEVPQLPGYDFAGFNAASERVGGDYYDFIPITKTDVGIVVADVAGKGFGAGLVMASLRSALRMRVETTYSIRTVMGNVNRFLHDSTGPERFVTAFYGVFDSITGRLTYVNAGHDAPLLIHNDGRVESLKTGGPLLGVIPEAEYFEAIVEIEAGAVLILFTDGITEAGGDHGEEFGEGRILQIAKENKNKSADYIAHAIEQAAVRFNGAGSPIDDRTVLVVTHL